MRTHRRRAWAILPILAALLAAAPGASADVRLGAVVDDVSLGDALLVAAVGSFFGLDTTVVVNYRDRHRLSFPDIVLMMYLARTAGCDHHRVFGLRGRGHGWGRIAQELGVHPGTFNKMRKGLSPGAAGDKAFEEAAIIWFLAAYHGAPQADVRRWHERGHSAPDIFIALDFSAKCGRGPEDLLTRHQKAKSWQTVGNAVGLSSSDVSRPGKPKGGSEFRGNSGNSGKPEVAGSAGNGGGHGAGGTGNSASHGRGKGQDK